MTSLVDFQKSIFDQIEAFKSRGDERLVVRFSSGGLYWAMDSSAIVNVSQLPPNMPLVPAAPQYVRGLVQQDGNVLTVFDLGHMVSGKMTPKNRTNRVLTLGNHLALASALLVEKTFSLVSLPSMLPTGDQGKLPASVQAWVEGRWKHEDSANIIWHWIHPDALLADAAFASRRTQ